jgi:hypothetical protein
MTPMAASARTIFFILDDVPMVNGFLPALFPARRPQESESRQHGKPTW